MMQSQILQLVESHILQPHNYIPTLEHMQLYNCK